MQIILLSGGSGTRLWPLSNNARSKQFLPLLEAPDGSRESMVQRVVRQIGESSLEGKITIATNMAQRDVIINQLGEDTDMVLEPCRRDTFPAIALACSYLSLEKGLPADETVIVMPCDPYTEAGYFDAVARMARALGQGAADLVLMGVTPTYPSSKYGYVVPEGKGGEVLKVQRFTEKPSVAGAEALLAEGALWNGGVFAFKLGYMMDIARKYVEASSFEQVSSRYEEFPKISFDYEVVEKAESVAVVPYTGAWKDLGTWNTLSEELSRNDIGNVTLGKNNVNTHVVNELGIPVFCDGLENVIVACSPDGIIACAKGAAENIKGYVDKLATRPMYEERRWGVYKVIDSERMADGFCALTKSLTIKAGKNISYQRHNQRSEVWTFIDGEGLLVLDGKVRKVGRGDVINIAKGQLHAVKAISDLTFIEVQSGQNLVEEDIERYDWDWSDYSA